VQGVLVIGEPTHGIAELDVGTSGIEIGIPPGTAVQLDAKSVHGRVRDTLGDIVEDAPEPATGNTVELSAHIVHGDILVRHVPLGETSSKTDTAQPSCSSDTTAPNW
jgi:hypothetical protein